MKQHKGKIIAAVLLLCVLAAAYLWGGNYAGQGVSHQGETPLVAVMPNSSFSPDVSGTAGPESPVASSAASGTGGEPAGNDAANNAPRSDTAMKPDEAEKPQASAASPAGGREGSSEGIYAGSASYSEARGMILDPETGQDKYRTDPVPAGQPLPVEPQDTTPGETAYTATLSVRCDTILDNMKRLDKEKEELVPEDGIIFPATTVTFYGGESVLNLLQREMKKNKIHMEFRNTPMYNSAYIRGINNLYEFDAGELSGWMYKVNGWFPNYGVSRYQLKAGDVVEFVYTCNLGQDVGGYYSIGGE